MQHAQQQSSAYHDALPHVVDDLTRKAYAANLLLRGLAGDPAVCPQPAFLQYFQTFQDLGYLLTTLEHALAIGLKQKPDTQPILFSLSDDQTAPIGYFLQDYHFIYPVQQAQPMG